MTISSTTNRVSYTGNDSTTEFSFPYYFLADADLVVIETVIATGVQTAKMLTTDYTVGGAGEQAGGTVTMLTAPASTISLTIYRDPAATQSTDWVENDPDPAETKEEAFDRLTMMVQRLKDVDSRSMRQPEGDTASIDFLPAKVVRASMYLGFDADGDPIALDAPADTTAVSAFVATLLDDTTADVFVQTLVSGLTAETAPATDDVVLIGDTDEAAGNKMTLANVLKVVNGLTADIAPDKTADYVLSYDASASAAKKVILSQLPFPRGYLSGFGLLNNVSDVTNDVDFSVGECRDSTNAVNLVAATAMTKRLDAAWAAGTGSGGRMSAAALTDTTYSLYVIRKDSDGTCEFGFDASATAPTMPSGYTYFRRIGLIVRAGGAILPFINDGDSMALKTPVQDVSTSTPGNTAVTATLASCPIGVRVAARITVGVIETASGDSVYVSDLSLADLAPSATASPGFYNTKVTNQYSYYDFVAMTNTSAQIRYRAQSGAATATVKINTLGWIDRRGRDS